MMQDSEMQNSGIEALRASFAGPLLGALWGLALFIATIAWLRDLPLALPISLTAIAMMLPVTHIFLRGWTAPLARYTSAAAMQGLMGLLVLAFEGTNLQIDMHMAFYAGLAIIAGWCCAISIVLGAGLIALHHLILNFVYPLAVFPDGDGLHRVAVHAIIVISETLVLAWLTQRLSAALATSDAATVKARTAQVASSKLAEERQQFAAVQATRRAEIDSVIAEFRARVESALAHMTAGAREMRDIAAKLTGLAGEAARETGSASEVAMRAAEGVQGVAAATEELSSSIGEIGQQVGRAIKVVETATADAAATNNEIANLAHTAQEIGAIVELIRSIADQTNLLALNATIEAARAGEAGKGFAVVASEVKSLATQTARATEQIGQQIAAVQSSSKGAVEAIARIASRMQDINSFTAAIGAAIEQQGASTGEISGSIGTATHAASSVTSTLKRVRHSADESAASAKLVLAASDRLETSSSELKSEVERFLKRVAA
jgi:methyl-accepting chemotaxis protein